MEGSASTAGLNSNTSAPTGMKASLTVFTALDRAEDVTGGQGFADGRNIDEYDVAQLAPVRNR